MSDRNKFSATKRLSLIVCCSYEALPPNFSLWENMIAGGFAGVAVSPPKGAGLPKGTRGSQVQEHSVMYPVDMLKVMIYHRDLI